MNLNKRWADMINAQPMFDVLALANKKEREGNYLARMEIGDTPGFKNNSINRILMKSSQEPHRYSPSKGKTGKRSTPSIRITSLTKYKKKTLMAL